MIGDIVYGAFIGTSSVLLAMFWLAKIDQGNRNEANKPELLAPAPAYKRFTLVVMALCVVSNYAVLTHQMKDATESALFYSFAIAMTIFVTRMTFDSFLIKAKYDEQGIIGFDKFRGEKRIGWGDIKSIKFDTVFNVFVIKSENEKIRLSRYSTGIYQALHELATKAPESSTQAVTYFLEKNTD
jgi:hypothetical protein